MFESLLNFWKGKDFLTQVLSDFKEMLEGTESMFRSVCATLIDNVENPELKKQIYDIDKKVNQHQKGIRKRIVEHLALQPTVDTASCLCLMSVVKDAERIGDYAKNLYEVTVLLNKPVKQETYQKFFNRIDKEILTLFDQTIVAFMESDDKKATNSWEFEKKVGKKCDEILKELASSDLNVNEGVCFALMARYFKRVIAHLVNIATSVILPIDELDFFDEKTRKEKIFQKTDYSKQEQHL